MSNRESAVRVSLHYQIVRLGDLSVNPAADMALTMAAGELRHVVRVGEAQWLGGLACHSLGFCLDGAAGLDDAHAGLLAAETAKADSVLAPLGARLLPGGCHPFMDPARETWIWNHDGAEVFSALDAACKLKSAAWSNHGYVSLALPFDEDGFAPLFAALRLVAAISPALAAASPVCDGGSRGNASERVLSLFGRGQGLTGFEPGPIPNPASTPDDYFINETGPLTDALAVCDTAGVLAPQSLPLRGLRVDPDRSAIVFELCDLQECPRADLAVATLVVHAARTLAKAYRAEVQQPSKAALDTLIRETARLGEPALVSEPAILSPLGLSAPVPAGEIWRELAKDCPLSPGLAEAAGHIASAGTLSRRIRTALGDSSAPRAVIDTYGRLCDCLAEGTLFTV